MSVTRQLFVGAVVLLLNKNQHIMNITNLVHTGISARLFAGITIVSLLLSAFPVAFFVANASTVFPSTNAANQVAGSGYVVPTTVTTDDITFDFINTNSFASCFEYRTDGDTSQISSSNGGVNYNPAVLDGLYPFYCLNNVTETHTIAADEYIEIRLAFGAETDERFDWTRFDLTKEEKKVDICHFHQNGFNAINVSINSIVKAHGDDTEDIIPVIPELYPDGQNLDTDYNGATGAEVLAAGCVVSELEKTSETIVVTGDTVTSLTSGGWLFNRDVNNATPIEFNEDESVIGDGALYVLPISNTEGPRKFIGEYFPVGGFMSVDDFVSFSYDFKIGAGGDSADAGQFYLNIYTNLTDPAGFYDCRYDYVPTTGSTGSFTTFEAIATANASVVAERNGATCPDAITDLPDGSTIRAIVLNLGDTVLGDADLDGYFDKVVLDTPTKETTFNFEPEEEVIYGCTDEEATNYNPDATEEGDVLCEYPIEVPERCSVLVDEITVPANSAAGANSTVSLDANLDYFAVVSGTYTFGAPKNGGDRLADAEYSLDAGTTDWVKEFDSARPDVLDLFIDGVNPDFGAFRSDHMYGTFFAGTGAASNFAIQDNPHSDNSGELGVAIYECQPEPVVTVSASKIVCDYEDELPNWGKKNNGRPTAITSTTATDWLAAQTDTTCRLVDDWQFQWSDKTVKVPNQYNTFVGEAPGWNTFTGVTEVPLFALAGGNLEFREVLTEDYIPFSGGNDSKPSAEFYCGNDVFNYDNLERINKPKADETYHCVAWNVPKVTPQCELDIYSDTTTVVKDTNGLAVETYDGNNRWTADIANAVWVWITEQVTDPKVDETVTFVETFTVDNPTLGNITIAHDNWLTLDVNGTEFVRNQNGYQDFQKFEQDILSALVSGKNRIEMTVTNLGTDRSNYRSNPAGTLFHIEVEGDPKSCGRTTEPESEPEPEPLPPVATCSYVSDFAINNEPSQGNVDSNLTTYSLNDLVYGSGDEFDLFVLGDTSADGAYQDEVVVERTADGLEVFFYGNGSSQPVKEFSGTFTLQGVDLTNAVITAGSESLETTGTWPDAISLDQSTGVVTFTMYTNTANDSFVISGLSADCGVNEPDTYTISGVKYEVDGETETPVAGWTIYLFDELGESSEPFATAITNPDGVYSFEVEAGEWRVEESLTFGEETWTQLNVESNYPNGVIGESGAQFCFFEIYDFSVDLPFVLQSEVNFDGLISEGSPVIPFNRSCDFYNQYTGSEDEEDNGEETVDSTPERTSSRSSGTRTNRSLPQAAPAPLVLGASTDTCPFLVDHMQMGAQNDPMEVMKLQLFLNIFKDMYGGTANPVTGTFGIITDTNVKAFQTHFRSEVLEPWFNQGIVGHTKPTGFVYKTTLWKINDIVCGAEFPSLEGETLDENVDLNARAIED